MAYVPPHRRVEWHARLEIDMKYANSCIRVSFAVDAKVNPPDNLLLDFKLCAGESLAHQPEEKLYTIFLNADSYKIPRCLTTNDSYPWMYAWKKMKCDFRKAFDNGRAYFRVAKPSVSIRFGKILFHGTRGFAWDKCVSPDILDKNLKGERGPQNRLRKTFDTNIPEDIFDALRVRSFAGLVSSLSIAIKTKVVYVIQVEDDLNPHVVLKLTCRNKDGDDKKLELKKIEEGPVGHFVADISCLNKLMDVRLLVVTEKRLTDLSGKDRECIEAIVESARVEDSAKGGLRWPLGGSARQRFKVKKAMSLDVTTMIGKTKSIEFQHANRGKFEASSGQVSNGVTLKLTNINKYLRDQRQWEEDEITNMMEDLFKWIWTELLAQKVESRNTSWGSWLKSIPIINNCTTQ